MSASGNRWAKYGIRSLFRSSILTVALCAFLTLSHISFRNVTGDELRRSEDTMRSELGYICRQLETLDARAQTFGEMANASKDGAKGLEAIDPRGYQLLSDPVGDVLSGYTVEEDGVVAMLSRGTVVSSDEERMPAGSYATALLGSDLSDALEAAISDGQLHRTSFSGIYEDLENTGVFGDDAAYVLARAYGDYDIMMMWPSSKVYADRDATMGRETTIALIVILAVCALVDRLLELMVLRRIDRTNDVLERITSGELDERVDGQGTREFVSLSSGINTTVEALQGWIAEAKERMRRELSAGRAIQESVLISDFSVFSEYPAFDIYARMSAAREVGGDFYDAFVVTGSGSEAGKLVFLIADVSGKGIPAALFMMKAITEVRNELQGGSPLAVALENATRKLTDGNDAFMFVTMWAAVLDYPSGRIEYVNAGHNPPLLYRQASGWQWLTDKSGTPLGFYRNKPYTSYHLDCQPGDKLLLYTDGVTEAANADRDMYGVDRLLAACTEASDAHPQELVAAIRADIGDFVGDAEQFDDITMLSLELCDATE